MTAGPREEGDRRVVAAGDGDDGTDGGDESERGVHEVTLEWRGGRRTTVPVPATETVLAAAEEAAVALPFGCRTGACATCTGRLRSGEVEHVRPPRALKDRHLAAGYVLLCIAEPRTDCRVEVGARVGADLLENPWK